jgi:hypothetical protein
LMTDPHVEYLSHHWIVLAAPAFLPALVVVGVVLYVAIRDRRGGRRAGGGKPDNSHQRTDASPDQGD